MNKILLPEKHRPVAQVSYGSVFRKPDAIDVCVTAARRPDLLAETLESFDRNLLSHFEIGRFIVNIDPVFGTMEDEEACIDLVRSYRGDAIIYLPEAPGFTAAVKRNWRSTTAETVLHLEDDWLLQRAVSPGIIDAFRRDSSLAQICFNHATKAWDGKRRGTACYHRRRHEFLGFPTPFKRKVPAFLTCPSFFRGSFLRGAADLLDLSYDPEKQFFSQVNRPLESYVSAFHNMMIGDAPDYYITDTGREWRESRGIEKYILQAQSYWQQKPAGGGTASDAPF
jgi:hypothetical protein